LLTAIPANFHIRLGDAHAHNVSASLIVSWSKWGKYN